MKTRITLSLVLVASVAAPVFAKDKEPEPPVPIKQGYPAQYNQPAAETSETQQRLYGPGGSLVAPEKAKQVVDSFRAAYEKLGKPRVLFFVNRELVDEASNMKLTGRTEKTESVQGEKKSSFEADPNAAKPAGTAPQTQVNVAVTGNAGGNGDHASMPGKGSVDSKSTKVTAENTYTAGDKTAATLADRQTVREVERLFGRPFRYAGAALADQKVAASLIADKPIDHFITPANDAARKDREALAKIVDVAIEVLVASRNVTIAGVSGDSVVSVPDIQVTAVRLSDSAIIGQASSSDVLGRDQQAGRLARQYGVRDIAEATALALMEDMTLTAK